MAIEFISTGIVLGRPGAISGFLSFFPCLPFNFQSISSGVREGEAKSAPIPEIAVVKTSWGREWMQRELG